MDLQERLEAIEAVHGDSTLSATGEKQLRFGLKTQAIDFQRLVPDVVFCSPLKRALRTALVAYPTHEIVVDANLRELDANVGMQKQEMHSFIEISSPDRKAKVDTSRVPDDAWWSTTPNEDQEKANRRVQRAMKHIYKKTSKGKVCAIVAHGGVFRTMMGKHTPFPKVWGNARGFPKNFKPYFAAIAPESSTSMRLKVIPATMDEATVVLVRHAHSRAQEANTLMKKIRKFRSEPHKRAEAAGSLDEKIRKFKEGV